MNETSLLEVFINSVPGETRLALTENGRLKNLVVTFDGNESLIGNIYLGRVEKVVAGMNAAFIDIGRSVSGFLSANDGQLFDPNKEKPKLINILFKEGDSVLVQITRDESNGKGAKLTTRIDLVGRTIVALLGRGGVSISKNIVDAVDRERLTSALDELETSITGLIVRTNAQFVSSKKLQKEAENLLDQISEIVLQQTKRKPPACLYKQVDQISKFLRDFGTSDWQRIIIDERGTLMKISGYIMDYIPELGGLIEFSDDSISLFETYDLDQQIEDLLQPTITLPSGGRLIIEETEALISVDVDSGSHNRECGAEAFARAVNEEAAIELARQLVLRNLAGQIVVDFLPMKQKKNRQYIQSILSDLLVQGGNCNVYGFSRLGLLEMIRQRAGENLGSKFNVTKGYVKTVRAIAIDLIRAVLREIDRNPGKMITVRCSHSLYLCFQGDMKRIWVELLNRTGPIVILKEFSESPRDHFELQTQ
jgi:ribonuclease G